MSRYKGKWNYCYAGYATEFNDPDIFYRVLYWPDEGDSNHDMGKGQPVVTIGHKRILIIGTFNCLVTGA